MKKFKISIIAMFAIAAALFLVACSSPDKKTVAAAKEKLEIQFTGTETATTVENKLTLPDSEGAVSIEWTTSNATVVSATGIVTRQTEDKDVTLTATLTLNKVTDTKEFEVKVLKLGTKGSDLITTHYATTLSVQGYEVTKDLDLVSKIGDYTVTWELVGTSEYLSKAGKILKTPTHTQGNQTVTLKAVMSDGTSKLFFIAVKAAPQTVEEKINAALDFATLKPSGEFQLEDFKVLNKVKIDGEDVAVAWVSSDETLMTPDGKLRVLRGDEPEVVTLTATITLGETTLSREVDFKLMPVIEFDDLTTALTTTKKGDRVYIENVNYFGKIDGGYYIASPANGLAYIHSGTVPIEEGKMYTVVGNIDIYNGVAQLKSVMFLDEVVGVANVVTPKEITIAEYVAMNKPGSPDVHSAVLYELKDVEIKVDGSGNYNTFIVKQKETDKATDKNSVNIYYSSNKDDLAAIKGQKIKSIHVVHKGYHTNEKVWYADFVGKALEVELDVTAAEGITVAENLIKSIPNDLFENQELAVVTNKIANTTIAWTTSNSELITDEGLVRIPTGAPQEVTLTAVITSTVDPELTKTVVKKISVGIPVVAPIADFLALANNGVRTIKGVVTGNISNNSTWILQDAAGTSIAFRLASGDKNPAIGDKITFIAKKGEFNGLVQANAQLPYTKHTDAITLAAATNLDTEALTEANLKKFQAHNVSLSGLYVESYSKDSYGNINMTLVKLSDLTELNFKWDSRIIIEKNALTTVEQGDVINLVGAILGWNKGPQFETNGDNQVTKVETLTDAQKVAIALIGLKDSETVTEEKTIVLDKKGSGDEVISWSFKDATNEANELVNLETGLIKLPTEYGKVTVVLVATGKLNDAIMTKELTITIEHKKPVVVQDTVGLIIYEIYGAGGNSGASHKNDYIVLYNGTSKDIDLDGFTLQYASATGNFPTGGKEGTNFTILKGIIKTGEFFLVKQSGGSNGVEIPEADFTGSMTIGGTNAKIALAKTTDQVTGPTHEIVIDFVGIGTATTHEGTGAAPAMSTTQSIKRTSFVDSNDNSKDFAAGTIDLSYLS